MTTHRVSFLVRFYVKDDMSLEQINRGWADAPNYRGWMLTDRTMQAHDESMPWLLGTVDLGTPVFPGDIIAIKVNREIDAESSQDGPGKTTIL
jgi:hypothetical protein